MTADESKTKVEYIKEGSLGLRGTIAEELANDAADVSEDAERLLKFHGTYFQDNRDTRKERRKQGLDKEFIFMVRNKMPGGKFTANQFLGELDIADQFGYGSLRLTTRQGIQIHGIVKGDLWKTIHQINVLGLSTQSACGDVNRNVCCCPAPLRQNGLRDRLQSLADTIAAHLTPRTGAYREIWLEDPENGDRRQVVTHPAEAEPDPIYGKAYMPRKFKVGIAMCNDNCTDVYDQDVGLLAVTEGDELLGFNVLVGGGMGTTPSDKRCFPAIGKRMAFIPFEHVLPVVTAIVLVQRDFGNRGERKQARMKYLIHQWGLPRFKACVEEYLSTAEEICGVANGTVPRPLAPPHAADVVRHEDHLGWHDQGDGKWFLGLPVENGRVKDEGSMRLKSALRVLLDRYQPAGRLTAHQNILLCNLDPTWRSDIETVLSEYGVPTVEQISNVRRMTFACPALPTCGLAITESERAAPTMVAELETELARLGLDAEKFGIHMTGCPNGCTRPYNSDIGIVGRSIDGKSGEGKYTVFLGGSLLGNRMNTIFKDLVPLSQITNVLRPVLMYFKQSRQSGESFGDFCHRMGTEELQRFASEYESQLAAS
ncbi:MAG: NADPH-dependent assimilatory sulfite reductase hemoprotein subunit [Planctomycetaceae bacterium]